VSVAAVNPRDPESGGDPVAEARAGLKAAFAARIKAGKALEAARAATARAAALAEHENAELKLD
jgi:hypothetical protein